MRFSTLLILAFLTGCMAGPTSTTSVVLDETMPTDEPADEPTDEPESRRLYAMASLATLAETGLYSENSLELHDDVREYIPRFSLYSDTLEKRRYIALPEGSAIDAANAELWEFPVGTRLWKEFRLGRGDAARLLETRYMEKREGQWVFGTYVWDEEQQMATLWDGQAIANAAQIRLQGRDGEQLIDIAIPSYDQCLTCHIQHGAHDAERPDPVLGFSAVQLDLTTMQDLRNAEQLANLRLSRSAHSIPARDDRERNVIGYMHANCGHCHNPRRPEFVQPMGSRSFLLDYNIATVRSRDDIHLLSLIHQPTFNRNVFIPGVSPNETKSIVPGRPESSMLYYRMRHSEGADRMPKIGVSSRHLDFIEGQLRPWIQSLPPR